MNFDAVKKRLITEAEAMELSEYEIYFMESSDISTETLKQEISSFSSGVSGGVSFRCIVDGHMGCASTELLTEDEMAQLVKRAISNARCIESDDKAILFSGSAQYAKISLPDTEHLTTSKLKSMALDIQKNTYSQGDCVTDGTQSAVFWNEINMELINSHGLHLSGGGLLCGAYVQAVIQKQGESQDDFQWSLDLSPNELKRISAEAVACAESKVGAVEIESGKYDVIISGKKMKDLLASFASAFSAKNALLGMSLLKGKEGEVIAGPNITVVDDPMHEGCPMQTAFDGEGVATYKKNVIEKGVLKTLLYDLSTADRAGVSTTGNGQRVNYSDAVSIRPYSFYIEGGTLDEHGLKEKLKDGIYITEFKGMHAGCNAVTGDFSIESAGYRVRNGKCCEAIKSFTVAGNFFTLLREIEEISNRVTFGIPSGFTVYGSPDVLVRQMSIAGK